MAPPHANTREGSIARPREGILKDPSNSVSRFLARPKPTSCQTVCLARKREPTGKRAGCVRSLRAFRWLNTKPRTEAHGGSINAKLSVRVD